jgi:hypothetical protein
LYGDCRKIKSRNNVGQGSLSYVLSYWGEKPFFQPGPGLPFPMAVGRVAEAGGRKVGNTGVGGGGG